MVLSFGKAFIGAVVCHFTPSPQRKSFFFLGWSTLVPQMLSEVIQSGWREVKAMLWSEISW